MPDSKHRFHRAAALAACAGIAAPAFATTIDFTNKGTFTASQWDESDLHITAQSSPGVAGNLHFFAFNGLGVAGGSDDNDIDGTERVFFAATSGDSLTGITIHQFLLINSNGNNALGEGVIEAFLGNTSLGTRTIGSPGPGFDINISALFLGLTLTSFTVSPVDKLIFTSVDFTVSPLTMHWTNAQSGQWNLAANWDGAAVPGSSNPVVIGPSGGLIVSGPTGNATISALTVGAQSSGIAVLDLSSAADLQVTGIATVQARGAIQFGANNVLRASELDNSGELRGPGQVDATLNNQTDGRVTVASGQRIEFTGAGTNQNAGTNSVVGGELDFASALNMAATGSITARDALLTFSGGLTNAGQINVTGGVNDVYGDLTLTGGATGGRIITSGQPGTTAFFYGNVLHNGAGIDTADGNLAVFFGNVSGAGPFTGSGAVRFEGTYAPGNSPALISFGGDLSLAPSASLDIELTGPARGTQFDAADVAGKLTLHGTLNLSRPSGYDPAYLYSHLILHAAQREGAFDAITGNIVSPTKWLAVTYTNGDVLVTAALPGDANLDGTVNFSDFVALSNHFGGSAAGWAGGDFNADGVTNFSDFVALSNSFGKTGDGSELADGRAAGVPEPSTLILISLSLPALSRRRRSTR